MNLGTFGESDRSNMSSDVHRCLGDAEREGFLRPQSVFPALGRDVGIQAPTRALAGVGEAGGVVDDDLLSRQPTGCPTKSVKEFAPLG
jgi:hypothetical protein